MESFEQLTQKGLRVLACAYKDVKNIKKHESLEDQMQGLVLVGFIAIAKSIQHAGVEHIRLGFDCDNRHN